MVELRERDALALEVAVDRARGVDRGLGRRLLRLDERAPAVGSEPARRRAPRGARGANRPSSIQTPRSASSSPSSRQPSSATLSETQSGSSLQPRIVLERASTSPPVIHSPVVSEISTSGIASRNAATAASLAAGARLSRPSSSRGCRCSEPAPASTTARASRASSSGVSGSASWSPGARVPLRAAWTNTQPRPGGVLDDRLVDQPLDRRLVVGVDVAAAQWGLEPRGGLQRERAQVAGQRAAAPQQASRLTGAGSRAAACWSAPSGRARRARNAAPIVAVSTFSSCRCPRGWPTLTTTMPPGVRRSRASSKNSRVER